MVKFGDALEEKKIEEWRDYYVNYVRLKGWIKELETSMSAEAAKNFFDELTLNIDRVEQFYIAKEDELRKRCEKDLQSDDNDKGKRAKLAEAVEDDVKKLLDFADENREGLRKIAKKFDKTNRSDENQVRTKDEGRNLLGKVMEWGSSHEELQERLKRKIPDYNFGKAPKRLGTILQEIGKFKGGTIKSIEGLSDTLNTPLLAASGSGKMSGKLCDMKELEAGSDELSTGFFAALRRKWRQRYIWTVLYLATVSGIVLGCWWKYNGQAGLNTQSYVVIWVTVMTLTALVWQWPSDSVMISATLFLTIFGMLNTVEAWGAFSNDVVLSVTALSVVGDAVSHTGFVEILFAKLLGETTNLYVAMLKIWIPCALGAASISNTCVMACSMPAVEDWCAKRGYHIALFFMPISYLMLIAGTFAVFSTSTNLVCQGLLVQHKLPQFSTFELGYPALVNMIVGLVYLMFATPVFLSRFMKDGQADTNGSSSQGEKVKKGSRSYFLRVRVLLRLDQVKTIEESNLLECLSNDPESKCFQQVDSVERHGTITDKPPKDYKLQFDDILSIRVSAIGMEKLHALSGFLMLSQDSSELYATSEHDTRELVEVILDHHSPLVGHRLAKAKTFTLYTGAIVAVRQNPLSINTSSPSIQPDDIEAVPKLDKSEWLQKGDQVVLDVPKGFAEQWRDAADFIMIRKLKNKQSTKDSFKAYLSGFILLVMLVFVAFSILPLFVCAMAAIVALAVTKCSTVDSMKKGIKLNVTLTIVGAFGLGTAIGNHGVAGALAKLLVAIFAPYGHIGLLIAIWLVVVMLGVIFHGTAVVALMFPLCHHVATESGIPLHQMMAVLCYAVACQMLSPVSYNTNLMAYAACPEYKFGDFTKVGAPLCVLLFCTSIPLCRWYWPESEYAVSNGVDLLGVY